MFETRNTDMYTFTQCPNADDFFRLKRQFNYFPVVFQAENIEEIRVALLPSSRNIDMQIVTFHFPSIGFFRTISVLPVDTAESFTDSSKYPLSPGFFDGARGIYLGSQAPSRSVLAQGNAVINVHRQFAQNTLGLGNFVRGTESEVTNCVHQ